MKRSIAGVIFVINKGGIFFNKRFYPGKTIRFFRVKYFLGK